MYSTHAAAVTGEHSEAGDLHALQSLPGFQSTYIC